ncbi:MAG: RES family NAD+ phosphorylase, partial [Pseudomonadales bacterium]
EKMVTVISAGTEFYRVRHASPKEQFSTFSEMGVPPVGNASAGRMNPAGISYLYVAYQKETAEKEVLEWSKRWFTAKYKTKVDIPIIDFSVAPSIPSIFEPELYKSRHNSYFLNAFIKDLIAPVSKDGKEHVDYVPTQIVSEYFRYRFKDENGNGVMGLKYPSVKDKNGTNIAVFSSNNEDLEEMFELLEIQECSQQSVQSAANTSAN